MVLQGFSHSGEVPRMQRERKGPGTRYGLERFYHLPEWHHQLRANCWIRELIHVISYPNHNTTVLNLFNLLKNNSRISLFLFDTDLHIYILSGIVCFQLFTLVKVLNINFQLPGNQKKTVPAVVCVRSQEIPFSKFWHLDSQHTSGVLKRIVLTC